MNVVIDKQQAHRLLDQLEPAQFEAVLQLLLVMADPVAASLRNAPFDDEPETEEERLVVERARSETSLGTSNEQLLREFRFR